MKKLISLLSILLLPLLVGAQDFGVWEQFHSSHAQKNPLNTLYHKVKRAYAARQKLPWVQLVEDQIHAAQPHGFLGSNNWNHILPLSNGQVSLKNYPVFRQRILSWQNALQSNPALNNFEIVTPDTKPVTDMPEAHARYIAAFLKAPTTVGKQNKNFAPVDVDVYQKFLVRVTLKPSQDAWPVHLIFNCFSKQMYVSYPWFEVPGVTFEKISKNYR